MAVPAATGSWHRFDNAEQSLCLRLNRSSRHAPVRRFFAVISRLIRMQCDIIWFYHRHQYNNLLDFFYFNIKF